MQYLDRENTSIAVQKQIIYNSSYGLIRGGGWFWTGGESTVTQILARSSNFET